MQGRPTLCVRRPKNTTSIGIPSRPYRLRNARNKPIAHVLSVVARSNRLLGLLKRTFGSHSKALFTGYRSMIRPIVNNTSLNFVEKHKYSLLVYALERNGIYTDLAGSLLHVDKLSVKVVVITRKDKM